VGGLWRGEISGKTFLHFFFLYGVEVAVEHFEVRK
jgi:hypothetical protein